MANLNDILSARENNMSQLAKYQRRVEEALQKWTMPNQTDINALNHYRYASDNRNKKYWDWKLKDIAKKEIASIKKDMDFHRKLLDNYTNSRTSQWWLIWQISQNSIESELWKLNNDLSERTKVLWWQYNNIWNITPWYTPTPSKAKTEEPSPEQETLKTDWWWSSNWWWGSKWWGSRSWWSRTWNSWAIKQQPSTYVDPNWVTHTWMTQDEFNQSMQMYEADNQWWYESQRNKTLPWWTTRWQLFDQALNKYLDNPDSFDDSAKQALINVWKQLWYWWDNWQASQQSQPTAQPNVQPTVQPSVQPAQTQSQYNWFDPSQVWWRTWLWTELDRRTQWWQINIPFSL